MPWPMQQQEGGKYDISDEFIMSHKDAQDVTTAVGDAYYAALLTLKGDSSVGYVR